MDRLCSLHSLFSTECECRARTSEASLFIRAYDRVAIEAELSFYSASRSYYGLVGSNERSSPAFFVDCRKIVNDRERWQRMTLFVHGEITYRRICATRSRQRAILARRMQHTTQVKCARATICTAQTCTRLLRTPSCARRLPPCRLGARRHRVGDLAETVLEPRQAPAERQVQKRN